MTPSSIAGEQGQQTAVEQQGPYVVTKYGYLPCMDTGAGTSTVSAPRAYATWTEMEHDVELAIEEHGGSIDEWPDVPISGGTVGPLPDGTLIEVEAVGWGFFLEALAPFPADRPVMAWSNDDQLEAFNAREAAASQAGER